MKFIQSSRLYWIKLHNKFLISKAIDENDILIWMNWLKFVGA